MTVVRVYGVKATVVFNPSHVRVYGIKATVTSSHVRVYAVKASVTSILRTISDYISITDTGQRYTLQIDTVSNSADATGITDNLVRILTANRIQSDSVGITDSLKIAKNLSDNVGITDNLTKIVSSKRPIANPVGISDAVTVRLVPFYAVSQGDGVGVTDHLSASIGTPAPPTASASSISDLRYNSLGGFVDNKYSTADKFEQGPFAELEEDGYGAEVQEVWGSDSPTQSVSEVLRLKYNAQPNESLSDAEFRFYQGNPPLGG